MSASSRPMSDQDEKEHYEHMSSSSREEILPELIRDIGRKYLLKHPRSLLNIADNLLHGNQDIAEKMAAYNPEALIRIRNHERFLINRYLELPNYTGTLAEEIRSLYQGYYRQEITPALLIRKISTETLQEIGRDYLKAHPKPTTSWLSLHRPHNNQEQAASLRDCYVVYDGTKEITVATAPLDLWNCLLSVYALLPNDKGEIARKLENKINNVFGIRFVKMDAMGGQSRELTNPEMVERARPLIIQIIEAAYKHVEMETKNDSAHTKGPSQ
jgi:hypothetical protein